MQKQFLFFVAILIFIIVVVSSLNSQPLLNPEESGRFDDLSLPNERLRIVSTPNTALKGGFDSPLRLDERDSLPLIDSPGNLTPANVNSGPISPCIPVRTPQDLDNVRNNLVGHYCQMNDIDLTNYSLEPIGVGYMNFFNGVYDGNNYSIRNFRYSVPFAHEVGIFGTSYGLIKNLYVSNATIIDAYYDVGILVGENFGVIMNSHASGKMIGNAEERGGLWGGLVGANQQGGNISTSSANVTMVSMVGNIGGLVGFSGAYTNLVDSHSYSTISTILTSGGPVGGLVGGIGPFGNVINSYSISIIQGRSVVGGLVGFVVKSTILNSYSHSNISGGSILGGLIGDVSSGNITNSFSTGVIRGGIIIGGLAGIASGGYFGHPEENSIIFNSSSSTSLFVDFGLAGGL